MKGFMFFMGIVKIIFGLILTSSIIGAILGIPMLIFGICGVCGTFSQENQELKNETC